jgi:hypothetical protein
VLDALRRQAFGRRPSARGDAGKVLRVRRAAQVPVNARLGQYLIEKMKIDGEYESLYEKK